MPEFHVAGWIDAFVDWLLLSYGALFDGISAGILALLLRIQAGLEWLPWWAAVAITILAAYSLTRRPGLSLILGSLLVMVVALGLWPLAVETLAVVIASVVLALLLGIPVGVLMAESRWANAALQPVLDAMQTMPSFVYLIPAMMLFGLGKVPAVLATLIYSTPPVIRLTNLGIRQVSPEVQEAALAYGATRWQLLKEVRLPLAMPSILAGVNQTTMMALSMVVIASMIGARGVGEEVLLAINRIDVGRGFEAGLAIVALAIVMDRLTQAFARRWETPGVP
ncbi:proline/glycine betaine ABC transporter permease [Limnochorda pilosa]|uniref:ABC transporter permease n=1 Tax=Limnochorda pilosa TaxID=1555112 RepID=UPI001ED5AB67|nr:proline/glycine betaine ABC transporter permease [Limnochorda pilosa]MBO2518589.1 choline ABC transporter permease subunit [Bacillota bacterium]